jgi:nucleoid-associated protein YgaU
MFDPTSRYFNSENTTLSVVDEDGTARSIVYIRRRFIPSGDDTMTVVEHTVTQGERLDNITARYLGDPTQFWRICDANNVFAPGELEEIGRVIKVTLPMT